MQRNAHWCKRDQQSTGGSLQASLALVSRSVPAWENTKATEQLRCLQQASLGALSGPSRQDTNLKEGRVTWSTELPRSEVPIERS